MPRAQAVSVQMYRAQHDKNAQSAQESHGPVAGSLRARSAGGSIPSWWNWKPPRATELVYAKKHPAASNSHLHAEPDRK